jgi:GH35 family endo-1,4-beta-xylanase
MLNRREFAVRAPISALCLLGMSNGGRAEAQAGALREAARSRGFEIGAFATTGQMRRKDFREMLGANFTMAANLSDNMEWASNPGLNGDPDFVSLTTWLDFCAEVGLRVRARNIYSHENNPSNAHLRPDGTPKNKSELEKTLVKRVEQVCRVLKGRNAIIQVIDEILADPNGGMRRDPFFDALGEDYVDILFHATHEAAPDALLVYFDSGPELDPIGHYFDKKRRDYLALLARLRKRNVPITGAAFGSFVFPPGGGLRLDRGFFKAVEDMDYDIHLCEVTVVYDLCGNPRTWHPQTSQENDRIAEEQYTKIFSFICQFKRLKEITFWAPVDNDNTVETGTRCLRPYKNARPGILTRDFQRKPVYDRLMNVVLKSKPTI